MATNGRQLVTRNIYYYSEMTYECRALINYTVSYHQSPCTPVHMQWRWIHVLLRTYVAFIYKKNYDIVIIYVVKKHITAPRVCYFELVINWLCFSFCRAENDTERCKRIFPLRTLDRHYGSFRCWEEFADEHSRRIRVSFSFALTLNATALSDLNQEFCRPSGIHDLRLLQKKK